MISKYFISLLALATVQLSLAQKVPLPKLSDPTPDTVWNVSSVYLVKWNTVPSDLDSARAMLYLTRNSGDDLMIPMAYDYFPLKQSVYEIQVPSGVSPGGNYRVVLGCIKNNVYVGSAYSEWFYVQ